MINKDNRKFKRILYSPAILIILFIILFVLLKALYGAYSKEIISYNNLIKQKNEVEKLIEREKNLAQNVGYLKTDTGIESEIRSKFRVAREGEYLAVIVDDGSTTTKSISKMKIQQKSEMGFIDRFLSWFGL
ncbi:MAG TPA: hypothetical protein VI775_01550 [Candidatus Paceibacterota bacterium]